MASSNSAVQPGHARTYFGSGKLTSFVLAWLSCSQLAQSLEPKTLAATAFSASHYIETKNAGSETSLD